MTPDYTDPGYFEALYAKDPDPMAVRHQRLRTRQIRRYIGRLTPTAVHPSLRDRLQHRRVDPPTGRAVRPSPRRRRLRLGTRSSAATLPRRVVRQHGPALRVAAGGVRLNPFFRGPVLSWARRHRTRRPAHGTQPGTRWRRRAGELGWRHRRCVHRRGSRRAVHQGERFAAFVLGADTGGAVSA